VSKKVMIAGNLDQNYHILKNVKEQIISENDENSITEESVDYQNFQKPIKKI
jgi:hypothetical protein